MIDENMTLNDVCRVLLVSRRAVQGYEKHGLVRATGRNSRGYLLYNAEAQEQIRKIKLYQGFGFQLKEIKLLFGASDAYCKLELEKKRRWLLEERENIDNCIIEITKMIQSLD